MVLNYSAFPRYGIGLYYMTKSRKSTEKENVLGEGLVFYSAESGIAYNEGKADLHAIIRLDYLSIN